MDTEEGKEQTKVEEKPQDFQILGPAVPGTSAGPQSNPPPQGTPNTASTGKENQENVTNFPGMMMNINPSMISMAQLAGIENLSMMQKFQSPPPPPPQQSMTTLQPHNSTSFTPNFQPDAVALAAFQAQQMSQMQHREALRKELNKVQNQIHLTQIQAPGSGTLMELAQVELNLKHKMLLAGMLPPM